MHEAVQQPFPLSLDQAIPLLKRARERLQGDIVPLESPVPEYLVEAMELCEGCTHYDPVEVYQRVG